MKEIEGKYFRFFKIAKKAALKSDFRTRHGAVLVKGGNVINISENNNKYCSFGMRFRTEPGNACIHAELGVILGVDRDITEGSTVYVARVDKQGKFAMSKPCKMCEAALRYVGVKKVVYTVSDNRMEIMKI